MAKRAIIRMGDPTSHGGTVLEAFPTLNIYGKNAAGVGHRGYCPRCKRDFVIVAGAENFSYFGKSVALEGMRTSCGAVLIATQSQATVDSALGSIGLNSSFNYMELDTDLEPQHHGYDMHFLLQGEQSGKTMPNVPYKITLEDGTEIIGKTNENGLTEKISSAYPAIATIIAPYHDDHQNNDTGEADADCECDTCISECA